MDLTQVDGCDPIAVDVLGTLIGDVGGTKLVALTIPPDLDLLGLVKTPLDGIGRIAPAVGKDELPITQLNRLTFPDDFEKASALSRWLGLWIAPPANTPGLERSTEALDGRLSRLRMQIGRLEEFHQGIGRQPDPLLSDGPPEIDDDTGIQISRGQSQLVEWVGFLNFEFSDKSWHIL